MARFWKRWHLRFSLRAVGLLMTAVAVALGAWSATARRQRLAVEKLQSLNASVRYSKWPEDLHVPLWLRDWMGNDYFLTAEEVALSDLENGGKSVPLPPEQLDMAVQAMRQLPHVRAITFNNTRLPEEELVRLTPLSEQIESIYINDPWEHMTGTGLRHLAGWPRLKDLDLYTGVVGRKSLEYLKELPALEKLCITGELDEAAFEEIAKCERLKNLMLTACSFDGKSLEKLRSAKSLIVLNLHNMTRKTFGVTWTTDHATRITTESPPTHYYFRTAGTLENWEDQRHRDPNYRDWLDHILPGVEIYQGSNGN